MEETDNKGTKPCETWNRSRKSLDTGQVLSCPYDTEKTRLVIKEMLDLLALSLVDKGQVCDQIVLTIGYDIENLETAAPYIKAVTTDRYGRTIPKHAHGTANLKRQTASSQWMIKEVIHRESFADPPAAIPRSVPP